MPTFVSKQGEWFAAKEVAVLPIDHKAGRERPEIYEGDDREASKMIAENNGKPLGMKSEHDPQLINLARQQGMTIHEYLDMYQEDIKQDKKNQAAALEKPTTHEAPKRKRGVVTQGGKFEGGFGDVETK
jgi:hypothetical protein